MSSSRVRFSKQIVTYASVSGSLLCVLFVCSGCGSDKYEYPEGEVDSCCSCYCLPINSTGGSNDSDTCAYSSPCSADCCRRHRLSAGCVDVDSCEVLGRPYIVQKKSLLPSSVSAPSKLSQLELPSTDAWGSIPTDLGDQLQQQSGDQHSLSEHILEDALANAGLQSSPWPEIGGTLMLEPRLPELLANAQVQLATASAHERDQWYESGLSEHASVGTFAKLCVELLVAGAPPRILRHTIKAQEEELLHAHISLALADLQRGADDHGVYLQFPEHSLDFKADAVAMRAAAIDEGLKGEGQAALKLLRQALQASGLVGGSTANPSSALGQLAWAMGRDEARHAALASEIIEWLSYETARPHPKVSFQEGAVKVIEL